LNQGDGVLSRIEKIKSALLKNPGKQIPESSVPSNLPKAAVCLILRPSPRENELFLFFVKRRTFVSDPWSGQMALPGGKYVETDRDLLATAIREVLEETGIHLKVSSIVGSLDEILPGNATIRVLPYVAISPEQIEISINQSEIQDYVWIPLSFFEEQKNLEPYSALVRGRTLDVRGYTYRDRGTIWGMTLRIIQDFFSKTNEKS
jgi:8-oxo-dGTP pyrophosphatase MutT (NUDIX family)